jgi:segregation and condensation protein B
MSLKAKLEAVIYAAEEPVTLAQLAALFADEALAWKAEQAAVAASPGGEGTDANAPSAESAAAEALPLLPHEFDYLGLHPTLTGSAAVESQDEAAGEVTESVPTVEAGSNPDASVETSPDAVPEASAQAGPDSTETAADPDLEAKRLARLRDREVRGILRRLIDELIAAYATDGRGIEIREIAGGYRMATKPECHDAVRLFVRSLKPALKLSLPALETLAVIAYKQPVTAPEVNEIRGVDSSAVFGSLLARKLIATAGRKQVIGRPILYKTTREFLLRFGLKDVAELPSMEEFEKMAAMELDEPESESASDSSEELEITSPSYTDLNLNLELDETAEDSSGETFDTAPATPKTIQTAETAARHEPPTHAGASAPAASPALKQAETETFSNDQEDIHDQENSRAKESQQDR